MNEARAPFIILETFEMLVIKFPNRETEVDALGFLLGRFSGRVFRSGEVIVSEAALEALKGENFRFTVLGPATYELMVLPPDILYQRKVLPWKSP